MVAALGQIKKFIRRGELISTGRPIRNFGRLLPREVVANWVLCAVLNEERGDERFSFSTDISTSGDGIIVDRQADAVWFTEHVMVAQTQTGNPVDIDSEILDAIQRKQRKGNEQYASGKNLVVLVEECGIWHPQKLAKHLPTPLTFESIWIVGLSKKSGPFTYNVVHLDEEGGEASIWAVRIERSFMSWSVTRTIPGTPHPVTVGPEEKDTYLLSNRKQKRMYRASQKKMRRKH